MNSLRTALIIAASTLISTAAWAGTSATAATPNTQHSAQTSQHKTHFDKATQQRIKQIRAEYQTKRGQLRAELRTQSQEVARLDSAKPKDTNAVKEARTKATETQKAIRMTWKQEREEIAQVIGAHQHTKTTSRGVSSKARGSGHVASNR